MKIVHLYAKNLKTFEKFLDGTGCKLNGSQSLDYLMRSLSSFNARDTMGLIVFRKHMTRKTLRLVRHFDELFVFNPLPIVVVCDDATSLFKSRRLSTKFSPLFLVDSVDGTISDIDVRRIFTTLACLSDRLYDLSDVEKKSAETAALCKSTEKSRRGKLADEVFNGYLKLGG